MAQDVILGTDTVKDALKVKINNDMTELFAAIPGAATATSAGIVELATKAEVVTGTDTARAVTPKGLNDRTALATRTGIVELATDAETLTGTDTTRACTPANVAAKMETRAAKGANADITSMTGLNNDGIPAAKIAGGIETATLAAVVITDHQLVRGNGGARGVQESTIIVSDNGEMTNPSQPAFNAFVNDPQVNKTGDGTLYSITGAFWTERVDQNADFSNGTFTAPITGLYQLNATVDFEGLSTAHVSLNVSIVTSNKTYAISGYTVGPVQEGNRRVSGSVLADMDATDTAYITIKVSSGTKVVSIITGTYFTGALIC